MGRNIKLCNNCNKAFHNELNYCAYCGQKLIYSNKKFKKRIENTDLMNKLKEIDYSLSMSTYTSLSFAVYSLALACFAIGLSNIKYFNFVLAGIILYFTGAIFMLYGYFKIYKNRKKYHKK